MALPLGGAIGVWRPLPRAATAALLALASGALITAVAVELFDDAVKHGGAWRAGAAFALGATVFIVVDRWIEGHKERRSRGGAQVGLLLLAAVSLDGLPENLAMGVNLTDSSNAVLLVAIFMSNLPEAMVGAQKMREGGIPPGRVVAIWGVTAVLLTLAVLLGYGVGDSVGSEALAWPLGFAAGAVLASLADTLMPEAFEEARGDPRIAFFTALGFLISFLIATA